LVFSPWTRSRRRVRWPSQSLPHSTHGLAAGGNLGAEFDHDDSDQKKVPCYYSYF
jgi:hypothetical protein